MAGSNITKYEYSTCDGMPVECFKFAHSGTEYLYTSNATDVDIPLNGGASTEHYAAIYIERDNIKPASKGDSSALTITLDKDNPVAKLYEGPPPERATELTIYRMHEQDKTKFDAIFFGEVAQAEFEESVCKITIKLENWLNKYIPNMNRQFFCCNALFDENCQLKREEWGVSAFVDEVAGLVVTSSAFATKPDGYFDRGFIKYGESIRLVRKHVGNKVTLQYPFVSPPRHDITIYPGCDTLYKTCCLKFNNHLNFTGCPYVPPLDPQKNPVGGGVYWVDSQVVQRDTKGFVGTITV